MSVHRTMARCCSSIPCAACCLHLVQHYVGVDHQVVLGICRQLVCFWGTVWIQGSATEDVVSQVVLPDFL